MLPYYLNGSMSSRCSGQALSDLMSTRRNHPKRGSFMLKHLNYGLGMFLSFCVVTESFAIGGDFIGNEAPSARVAGQGYVGVAGVNEDPTAVFSNPGAMTSLLGTQVTFGMHWENIHGGFKDSAGNETKERVTNVAVPNFAATQSFFDGKLSAGLSTQSQFGLETHWDDNSPMRYVATNSRLRMVDVMPALAYQVHPKFSVGVGADYVNVFDAQLDRQVYSDGVNAALGVPTLGAADATSSLRGQAADWGYHAGLVFQPNTQNSLGLTYHSKVNLRVNGSETLTGMSGAMSALFGGSNYSTSAYTDLVLPSNIQFGYAFKPTDKWTFEADTAWYHWSEGQDVNVRYAETNAFRLAVLNGGNPEPLTLRDCWSFNTGVNYKLSDKWQVRSGFWYEPWALPESTFNPAFMDLSRYGVSVGAGYAISEHLTIDAAYSAVFFHNRTINNSAQVNASGIPDGTPLLSGTAESNGTYSDFANLVALNLTYRFGKGN